MLRQGLVCILALQLGVGPAATQAFASPRPDDIRDTNSFPEQKILQDEADAIDQVKEGQLPPANLDPHGPVALLGGQSLEIPQAGPSGKSWTSYSLDQLDLNLPTVIPPDFYYNVRPSVAPENGDLLINAVQRDGTIMARQRIAKIKPLTWAQDRELLAVLDIHGELFALDMGYAKDELFRGPMPVVALIKTHILDDLSVNEINSIGAGFVTRGLEPPQIISPNAIRSIDKPITAGDFIVYTEMPQGRKLLGQFDRSVMKSELYMAEAVIAMLAYRVNPNNESQQILPAILQLQRDTEISKRTTQESMKIDPEVRDTLLAIQPDKMAGLVGRAVTNHDDATRDRDQFMLGEWSRQYPILREKAKQELEFENALDRDAHERLRANLNDMGEFWQTLMLQMRDADQWEREAAIPRVLFHRFMTAPTMRAIASFMTPTTAGAAAGVAAFGVDRVFNRGNATRWIVHYVNQTYSAYVPEVLKDSVYRITLLKSSFLLTSFVGISYGIGYLWSMKENLRSPIKGLATLGMRVWGQVSLGFWHRLAKIARQPNLMKAMALGFSPLAKVTPQSAIGQQLKLQKSLYPALDNPFAGKEAFERRQELNARALEALSDQKTRRQSLAWALALLSVSAESSIDPATLTMLTKNGNTGLSEREIQELASNRKFAQEWEKVATELYFEFETLKSGESIPELNEISKDELAKYFKLAQSKAKEIQNRRGVSGFVKEMQMRWQAKRAHLIPNFARFSLAEYDFLESAEPSNFVASQFWQQFLIDYMLAVGQIGLFGGRADLSKPEDLAADANKFLYTNPGHRAEMLDQVRIYMINVPARMSLVYQRAAAVQDSRYNPMENLFDDESAQSFVGSVGVWARNFVNIPRARYAHYFMLDLVRFIQTFQANALFSILSRMIVGRQTLAMAIPRFLWVSEWGTWGFAWPWILINRGNQMYEEDIDQQSSTVALAREQISRGLRFNDGALLQKGIENLKTLYEGVGHLALPMQVRSELADLEEFLAHANSTDLQTLQKQTQLSVTAISDMQSALQVGTPGALRDAETQLRRLYGASVDPAVLQRLAGVSLLEFSLRNPPLATRQNSLLSWSTILIGAITTTQLATNMSIITYRAGISWLPILARYTAYSAALYALTYWGEALFVKLWTRYGKSGHDQ